MRTWQKELLRNVDWFTITPSTSVRIIFGCAHHPQIVIMEIILIVHALRLECMYSNSHKFYVSSCASFVS